MSPLPARRMTDQVARALRDRIVSGELAAGERLDATTLADDFGVSRTPVREALLQLESAGLVVRQPYRGTVVAGVDANRLEEVTALRVDLEGRAAALGAPRLSDADLDRMAGILDELDGREHDPDFSLGVFNDLNRAFHDVLSAAADAPVLQRLIAMLGEEADRIRLHFDVRAPLAEAYHHRILDACRRRDGDAAARETRAHLVASFLGMSGRAAVPRGGPLEAVVREFDLETA